MIMRPPRSTLPAARFPYTPLFRSHAHQRTEHLPPALGARKRAAELSSENAHTARRATDHSSAGGEHIDNHHLPRRSRIARRQHHGQRTAHAMTDDPGTPQVHGSDVADDFLSHRLQYRAAGIRIRRCPSNAIPLHQLIPNNRPTAQGTIPAPEGSISTTITFPVEAG